MKKLKLIWTFEKEYTQKEFNSLCQEQNDVVYLGYKEIFKDYGNIDSCDDMHLQVKIKEILK